MKRTLVIFSDYLELGKEQGRLKIVTYRDKKTLPLVNIDGILIYGKVSLTSEVIHLCAKHKVPIVLLTKLGKVKALVVPPDSSSGRNKRLKQIALYFQRRLELAKLIVKKKILEIENVFNLDLTELKRSIEKAEEYSKVLGVEGIASRYMFEALSQMLEDTNFNFYERNYYPPKDEVNALLSFLYTLGFNLALGLILVQGFDPYISFLHTKRGEHASFASDLVEIIRPHLTYQGGLLLKESKITKNHFTREKGAFYLKKEGANIVLEDFVFQKENFLKLLKEFLSKIEKLDLKIS